MATQQQQSFIDKVAGFVQSYAPQYDIRVHSPIIAQAILESGWGTSDLAAHHNYFGLKTRANWTGKTYTKVTKEEYTPGKPTYITAVFRAYDSMEQGIKGYFEFLFEPGVTWYNNLKGVTDPKEYIQRIKADGYATSSDYVQQLISLIGQYDLTQYDPKGGSDNMPKLFVVCGHGGGDPGAGGSGFNEAERVRALAAEMKRQAGDQMTLGDTSVNWYASKKFDSFANPGCPVLELHMDSASSTARGGHVEIKQGLKPDQYDDALAYYISSVFPGRSEKIRYRSDLYNMNVCARKGINYRLLEICFISSQADLAYFNGHLPQIAAGILQSFGINASTSGNTGDIGDTNMADCTPASVWGYTWSGDTDKNTVYTKLAMTHSYAQQILNELRRTDDPTGRGVELTTHDHVKWMAAAQQEMLELLKENNRLLHEILENQPVV